MPTFGAASRARLATLHPHLQAVLVEAIKHRDFVIVSGHRGEADQNRAFAEGKSKLRWPASKHNRLPSLAVDVAPFSPGVRGGIDWNDRAAFASLAGFIAGIAAAKGVKLRWGGDWDSDGATADERFVDMPHLELAE
jgi:peptidoglycan L-alanyl-D-glutamate endopeptidase CwlK